MTQVSGGPAGGIAFKLNGGLDAMQQQQQQGQNGQEEFLQVLHTHQSQVCYSNGQKGLQLVMPDAAGGSVAGGSSGRGEERIPMIPLSAASAAPPGAVDTQSTTNSQASGMACIWWCFDLS